MAFLIAIIVIGIIIWAVIGVKRDGDISKKGIVADAIVSRVEDDESVIDDKESEDFGKIEHSYTYFVKYRLQDGSEIETRLRNAPVSLNQGDSIRIKYLPGKPDYVIPTTE